MKALKFLLVGLLILVNLVFADPSLADPPKYIKNPDYQAVTQELESLEAAKNSQTQVENYSPEELDKKIAALEFQKYTLESGINWGQCRNETGKTLGVYGRKAKKSESSYDNALYFLGDGQATADEWDCDGVYLPSGVKVAGLNSDGQSQDLADAVALKIVDGTQLVAKSNPDTGAIEFNVPAAKVFKSGDVNWYIPDVSQTVIGTRIANAPTNENSEEND